MIRFDKPRGFFLELTEAMVLSIWLNKRVRAVALFSISFRLELMKLCATLGSRKKV